MYENFRVFKTEFAGRPLIVETGKMAELANGSCLVRYGDTVILATATASERPRDGIDYFPLSVDFEEKLYAVGKIPGGFLKREGRPTEKAILASRVIDRPMRPLFPKDMRNDVAVCVTVMSVDQDNSPEIAGMLGASIAVAISDIPWAGPIAGVSVGLVDGKFVFNPTADERTKSDLALTVVGSDKKVVMIEAGANEVPNDVMFDAIKQGYAVCKEMVDFINSIVAEIGKPKFEYTQINVPEEMYEDIKAFAIEKVREALNTDDKNVRDAAMKIVTDEVIAEFSEKYPDSEKLFDECLYKLQKYVVRQWLLEGKRVDGRGIDEMRPLWGEVSVLPRTHGSGMFARGQTQV
ncbi:MAG: polyribonucleotide nucleotidyltransferase, partial [Clostridia bacterium]|nr:polyribonucleotide nucleotidyltransferase [Clostridia bacterium]